MNFLVSLTAVLGTIIALTLNSYIPGLNAALVPVAVGGFIYIAGSDLIPELHKEVVWKKISSATNSFHSGNSNHVRAVTSRITKLSNHPQKL